MSPEEALIRSVEADPTFDLPRLVYADWLDENGREPFADFLRTEIELAKRPLDSPDAPPLRERLWQAWAAVDAVWLHRFTQPKMLRANPTPFAAGWCHFPLEPLRPWRGTYHTWPFDSIPPLRSEDFLGTFDYLGTPPPIDEAQVEEAHRYGEQFDQFRADAFETDLLLPASFLTFVGDFRRVANYGSQTGCGFLGMAGEEFTVESVLRTRSDGTTEITFYYDSASIVQWTLFLHPSGGHCIVCRWVDEPEPLRATVPDANARTWFVAPSFETFVYRVWIENDVWEIQHADFLRQRGQEPPSITPALQAYIDHYRRGEPGA